MINSAQLIILNLGLIASDKLSYIFLSVIHHHEYPPNNNKMFLCTRGK